MASSLSNRQTVSAYLLGLELELDESLLLVDLLHQVVVVTQHGWELAGLVQTGSQQTGNLLDQIGRGQERVVLVRQLLDLRRWIYERANDTT